ncbi:chromate efflux transporter [Novosphingobium flavum]|uniref:Chromate efflux transporter n=1 Tax=Novosphingobium aerophilum TaxID=2839843 RepID=A0A7X1KAJ8_9SPHN|nr:chromate efflux transporter [Novosphingobium aerophilum]MBC2650209.1 chromate efflux transporter [Novosphingobium aerophilum]MBC2660140.1 chromate efflux transporter [Novosphingobium aerophilum]
MASQTSTVPRDGADPDILPRPDFAELVRVSARIGCLSFGGPAGQIALMHRELVEQRRWIDESQYLSALNLCHLLPGPEAQQLAIWIGWKLHGVRGGLAAGLLFVLPGALVILALSVLYAHAARLDWFAALFLGIKAAVLAIVLQALQRVAGRALNTGFKRAIALAAFVALTLFALPFPMVVLGAGAIGMAAAAFRPGLLALAAASAPAPTSRRPWGETIRAVIIGLTAWLAPLAAVLVLLGPDHVLSRIGLFFARLAVVTFGGAYAVLAYMAQQAVTGFGWLSAGEMADGLGLAETTPGPLIMVTQFVGFLAAFRTPAPFTPLLAGILGAALTTWVTFAPCFLWIFALAPWMERLEQAQRLKGGLAAITAAVVGVIANLTLWFALHVLFTRTVPVRLAGMQATLPDPASLDWRAALLAMLAAGLIFVARRNIIAVLALSALGGLALGSVG